MSTVYGNVLYNRFKLHTFEALIHRIPLVDELTRHVEDKGGPRMWPCYDVLLSNWGFIRHRHNSNGNTEVVDRSWELALSYNTK
jgi:hypothetical protein